VARSCEPSEAKGFGEEGAEGIVSGVGALRLMLEGTWEKEDGGGS
jgi:hypothetical protein